jgi:Family of unknown function (DUF6174)
VNRIVLALLAGLMLVDAVGAEDAASQLLADARDRWQSTGALSYQYVYQRFCECYRDEPPEIVVTVRNNRVERAVYHYQTTGTAAPADDENLADYYTIDDLFDKLSAAYARGARVEVDYDPDLGYPVRLFIDEFSDFTGEETDLRLSGVEIP